MYLFKDNEVVFLCSLLHMQCMHFGGCSIPLGPASTGLYWMIYNFTCRCCWLIYGTCTAHLAKNAEENTVSLTTTYAYLVEQSSFTALTLSCFSRNLKFPSNLINKQFFVMVAEHTGLVWRSLGCIYCICSFNLNLPLTHAFSVKKIPLSQICNVQVKGRFHHINTV